MTVGDGYVDSDGQISPTAAGFPNVISNTQSDYSLARRGVTNGTMANNSSSTEGIASVIRAELTKPEMLVLLDALMAQNKRNPSTQGIVTALKTELIQKPALVHLIDALL